MVCEGNRDVGCTARGLSSSFYVVSASLPPVVQDTPMVPSISPPSPQSVPNQTNSNVADLEKKINLILEQIRKLQEQLGLQKQQEPVGNNIIVPSTVNVPVTENTQPQELGLTGEETESFSYRWNRDLYYGLTNDKDVAALQNALVIESCYIGPVTGNFFRLTRAGVVCFQKKHNFTSVPGTGYIGPYTRKVLNEIYSK